MSYGVSAIALSFKQFCKLLIISYSLIIIIICHREHIFSPKVPTSWCIRHDMFQITSPVNPAAKRCRNMQAVHFLELPSSENFFKTYSGNERKRWRFSVSKQDPDDRCLSIKSCLPPPTHSLSVSVGGSFSSLSFRLQLKDAHLVASRDNYEKARIMLWVNYTLEHKLI